MLVSAKKILGPWCLSLPLIMAAHAPLPNTDMALLGRVYRALSTFNNSRLQEAGAQLTKFFEDGLAAGETEYGPTSNATSFSVSVFGLKAGESIFEYYYEAPELPVSSYTKGKLTEDTIYRTGSLGKAMTVYTWLATLGDKLYSDPITKYIPEFAAAEANYVNPIMSTNWSEVTVGSLAGQMSGIGRDFHLGDLAQSSFQSLPASATVNYGYPSLGNETVILCDAYGDDLPPCTRQQFLQGVIEHPPVNPPWYTPTYSNLAYAILGLAFEAATGGSFVEAADNIFQNKLGMISTSVNAPTGDYDAIIPRNDSYAIFTYNIGIEGPAGNQYTSIKDLKTWAQAIWNNKLLDPALTRKWLKPVTFTSRFQSAVGAPWEISRIPLLVNTLNNSSRIVDTYGKGGNIGLYSTYFALVPDYEIGFAFLTAGDAAGGNAAALQPALVDIYYNALEAAMKDEAIRTFPGTYVAKDLNSSVTLEVDGGTGVNVTSWISNGTDMFTTPFFENYEDFRLYPTDLSYVDGDTTYWKYYLATFLNENGEQSGGDLWNLYNDYWVQVDGNIYNNLASDSWIIGFGEDGMVQSVESQALRCTLYRK